MVTRSIYSAILFCSIFFTSFIPSKMLHTNEPTKNQLYKITRKDFNRGIIWIEGIHGTKYTGSRYGTLRVHYTDLIYVHVGDTLVRQGRDWANLTQKVLLSYFSAQDGRLAYAKKL